MRISGQYCGLLSHGLGDGVDGSGEALSPVLAVILRDRYGRKEDLKAKDKR